ncbi:PAS domain S-box protein [Terriglobus roseus]|uniref:histidine kinase n=1 Tax=Terriglobus roseus TaxID=392734 RepID=A0A1H4REK9_9BACT|nr:PAS domain S-box protein [Terriglobus roseus]SEC30320.1 PAS domain S-box-containing protein [Terriglobus roseus]
MATSIHHESSALNAAMAISPEQRRLQALDRLEISSLPDPALDEITQLVAQICDVPAAAVSFVERDRIWFKSRVGIPSRTMLRDESPCDETILGDDVFQIPDAAEDAHYPNGVIPIGNSSFRFYAGAPLRTSDGQAVGTLCVYDVAPRRLDELEANTLRTLARQVMARLELNLNNRIADRDARSRQRVESALTVERNFVSAVLDTVGALVVVLDTAGRIVRFNRICETISGYALGEVVGQTEWDTLVPAEDRDNAIATYTQLRDGLFPFAFENRWRTRDGSIRRIQWTATALLDAQGEVAFLIATGIDVTLQREAEITLRESEARYRLLIEGSLGAVFTHALDGTILSINTYGAENLGYTAEQMLNRRLSHFMPLPAQPSFEQYLASLAASGEAQGTFEFCHRDGTSHVVAYRNRLIEASTREHYALCFGVDITEKVRAEERLSALTLQSNSILDSVGDGIFGTDLSGCATVCNPAAAQILGYRPDEIATEILGKNIHALMHHTRPDGSPYPESECRIMNSARELRPIRVSTDIFWRKDGTSFPVEYVACPILNQGTATGIVVAFTDTTERQELDRMKDEFVSTVSHELRTPLTSMRASLGLIASGALNTRPDKAKQMLGIAIGNTDRLVKLVNDILELERIGSGKAELHYGDVDATDLLHRAAELLSGTAAKNGVRVTFGKPGVHLWADSDRILQTITNLLSNAIKFSLPDSEIYMAAYYSAPGEATLEVRDHGRGIPADKLEHIFGRFQQVDASDSRVMGGTGLGLAICRSIVVQHGGRIWAESELGHGARFLFTLPTKPSSHLR